MATLPEEC